MRSNPVMPLLRQVLLSSSPCALPKSAMPVLLIPLTSVVAGDKARLLMRSNPVIAVVATGVALQFALRTAEKRDAVSAGSPHKCCCGRQGAIARLRKSRASHFCDRCCLAVRPAHCQTAQSRFACSPRKCCCGRQGAIAHAQQSRDSRCCDRCCSPVRPAHCRKAQSPCLCSPHKCCCGRQGAIAHLAAIPCLLVVATGVALQFALRTAEKRNPACLVPLTSVVAGDKA
jgi:hypothetical protein